MDWKQNYLPSLELLSFLMLFITSSTTGLTFQKSASQRSPTRPSLKGEKHHFELLFQDNEKKSQDKSKFLHNDYQIGYLFKFFEDALLNDTKVLYQLQQLFFPPEGHMNIVPLPFSVTIFVERITDTKMATSESSSFNCTSTQGQCLWKNIAMEWFPEGSSLAYNDELRQYVSLIHNKLRELEYVSWNILQILATFGHGNEHGVVTFTLKVNQLEQVPLDEDVANALLALMTWVKAYARAFDQRVERMDSDKGRVFLLSDKQPDIYLESCVLMLFVSLNLLITLLAGVFLKSFSAFVIRKATGLLKESVKTLSLYWATALVLMVANIGCLFADIYAFHTAFSDGFDYVLYTKMSVVLFVLSTEPFIVYYTTRNFSTILNVPRSIVKTLCCCFSHVYGSRFAHTIAVSNILWFTHRLVTAFILVLFNIVVSPAETFTTMTLIFSVITVLIFVTTYVLHTCSTRRKKVHVGTICTVLCASTVGIVAISVVVSFALVYLILLDKGLQSTGVGGFLLSLFPPFLFFMIGLFIQKKFFRKKDKSKENVEEILPSGSSTGNLRLLAEFQHEETGASVRENTIHPFIVPRGRSQSVQNNSRGEYEQVQELHQGITLTNKHQPSVRTQHDVCNQDSTTLLVPQLKGSLYTRSS